MENNTGEIYLESETPTRGTKAWFKKLGCISIGIAAFVILYYLGAILIGKPIISSNQIIAHRGGLTHQPENTIAAFQQAIDDGVDWLEFDVQMTLDGELVVFHDLTVERTTDGEGAVKDLTFAEIRSLDAGNGEIVPTFSEVVQLAKEAGANILPEAANPLLYPGIEQAMVEIIVSQDYVDQTIVQSFVPETLDRFQEINPDIQLCMLYRHWTIFLSDDLPGNAEYVCLMAEMAIINPWMIQKAHNQGQQVFVWFGVLENSFTSRLMFAFGADGLMVDDQQALILMLER